MNKILYISSEAFPFIKTGGLGDVAGSLPRALQKNKQDVRLLLPAYGDLLEKVEHTKVVALQYHYGQEIRILETRLPGSRVKVWLVECPVAFGRSGNPYLDADGQPWDDNAFRFTLFAQVAVDIALDRCHLSWQPDIVHCNDWQSALVPALLSLYADRPATVFTIHNLAYQGIFPKQTFFDLGLPNRLWHHEGVEFHDQFSFIKGSLVYADRINTVSPTYAEEIQHSDFGYGLDGLLQHRSDVLSGIINGIDTDIWNPGTDSHLTYKYNRRSLNKKADNKTQLQEQLGLPVDNNVAMIGMVSRLVEQKGLDSILGSLPQLLKLPVQVVILGSGSTYYEKSLLEWAAKYPEKLAVIVDYNETLSHLIEAASDIYMMPSTFEPCGLNQLYSLRYGTIPVVRDVGGLADSVCDTQPETLDNKTATGFYVNDDTAGALISAIKRALEFYYDQPALWKQLQMTAMGQNFSWEHSANQYLRLYQDALADITTV